MHRRDPKELDEFTGITVLVKPLPGPRGSGLGVPS
jgi:hypothetical protein